MSRRLVVAVVVAALAIATTIIVPPGLRWLKVRSGQPSMEALIAKTEAALRAGDAEALVKLDHPDADNAATAAERIVEACGGSPSSVRIELGEQFGRDQPLRAYCEPGGPNEGIRLAAQNLQGGGMTRYFLALGVVRDTDLGR